MKLIKQVSFTLLMLLTIGSLNAQSTFGVKASIGMLNAQETESMVSVDGTIISHDLKFLDYTINFQRTALEILWVAFKYISIYAKVKEVSEGELYVLLKDNKLFFKRQTF